jgi:hypothetical protein
MRALVFLLLAASALACSTGGSSPIEALEGLEAVYVPIDPASMLSLNDALADKGYGNVTVDDFKRKYVLHSTSFGSAVVAYSDESQVPPETLFEPMSVTSWLERALAEETAAGVVLDPGASTSVALNKTEIGEALAKLPRQPEIPMEAVYKQ